LFFFSAPGLLQKNGTILNQVILDMSKDQDFDPFVSKIMLGASTLYALLAFGLLFQRFFKVIYGQPTQTKSGVISALVLTAITYFIVVHFFATIYQSS
jgi:hypothetical protein